MGQAKQRGTLEQRQEHAKGLLDLATARTGREVNMELVQVVDQEAFRRLMQAMTETMTKMTAKNKQFNPSNFPLIADAQDDGRLIIRINTNDTNDTNPRIIEVPAGGWQELTQQQFNKIENELDARHKENPEVLTELIGDMGKHIVSSKEEYLRKESISQTVSENATEILMIFDRSPEALEMAKGITKIKQSIAESFDAWLSTNNDFILFHWPKGKPIVSMMALDMKTLLGEALPLVAKQSASIETCLIRCNEAGKFDVIPKRWKELGGLIVDYS